MGGSGSPARSKVPLCCDEIVGADIHDGCRPRPRYATGGISVGRLAAIALVDRSAGEGADGGPQDRADGTVAAARHFAAEQGAGGAADQSAGAAAAATA